MIFKTIKYILILFLSLIASQSWATTWFDYSYEDLTAGNPVTNDLTNTIGPHFFEYHDPPLVASDIIRSKYMKFDITTETSWLGTLTNSAGTYGAVWSGSNPLTLIGGTTYYLGMFYKQEMIGENQVYHNDFDFDKLIEMRGPGILGTGFRWIMTSGFRYMTYTASKYTFNIGCTTSSFATCLEEGFKQNANGYTQTNPYLADYGKWYALVMGITFQHDINGQVRLWINGTLIADYTICPTGSSGATMVAGDFLGTIGQTEYNAPAHTKKIDRVIITDSWDSIIAAGLNADPEAGATPTPYLIGTTMKGGSIR